MQNNGIISNLLPELYYFQNMKAIKIVSLWTIIGILGLYSCQSPATEKTDAESIPVVQIPYQPSLALDDLFHDIQMAGIFPDSKTLVDCRPLSAPQDILSDYHQLKDEGPVDLEAFVNQHFEIPVNASEGPVQSKDNMVEHLNSLWVTLTRTPDEKNNTSSLLPLPYPYVVPGGRFREIYYWDSYFTMLGLLESQEDSLVVNMIRNFGYLIDTYGFIPNGNRSYYLGRSQPPFVVDLSLSAGGGEYSTQDGFGWTNGVTLALWSLLENGSNSNAQ